MAILKLLEGKPKPQYVDILARRAGFTNGSAFSLGFDNILLESRLFEIRESKIREIRL
jgi:hypothetical protein